MHYHLSTSMASGLALLGCTGAGLEAGLAVPLPVLVYGEFGPGRGTTSGTARAIRGGGGGGGGMSLADDGGVGRLGPPPTTTRGARWCVVSPFEVYGPWPCVADALVQAGVTRSVLLPRTPALSEYRGSWNPWTGTAERGRGRTLVLALEVGVERRPEPGGVPLPVSRGESRADDVGNVGGPGEFELDRDVERLPVERLAESTNDPDSGLIG